ncbi:hypothetical protein U1Q18_039304 [Sarracenia purpurea var. burkii]
MYTPNHDPNKNDAEAATLEYVDRFQYENFKSFYVKDGDDDDNDDVNTWKKNGGRDREDNDDERT